jgi:hypothetical protein
VSDNCDKQGPTGCSWGFSTFFFLLLFDNLMTVRRRALFFAGSCLLSDVSESGLEGLSWVSKVCLDGSRREEEEEVT